MCKILLSIKPEYASKILNGEKKYEFRRNIPKRNVDKVVVYSSYPEQKIVGEFSVKKIHKKKINTLWKISKGWQGIKHKDFNNYYADKKEGYAYEIGIVKQYKKKRDLSDYKIRFAPQSFIYLD